jgi:hypothetical protein
METRHCNGCNQVGHLVRKCPSITAPGNRVINYAPVGHVELNKEKGTETDFSVPAKLEPYDVPIKKEDLEEYMSLPTTINSN